MLRLIQQVAGWLLIIGAVMIGIAFQLGHPTMTETRFFILFWPWWLLATAGGVLGTWLLTKEARYDAVYLVGRTHRILRSATGRLRSLVGGMSIARYPRVVAGEGVRTPNTPEANS